MYFMKAHIELNIPSVIIVVCQKENIPLDEIVSWFADGLQNIINEDLTWNDDTMIEHILENAERTVFT